MKYLVTVLALLSLSGAYAGGDYAKKDKAATEKQEDGAIKHKKMVDGEESSDTTEEGEAPAVEY